MAFIPGRLYQEIKQKLTSHIYFINTWIQYVKLITFLIIYLPYHTVFNIYLIFNQYKEFTINHAFHIPLTL